MNGHRTRIDTLDAYRGIAILAVLLFHYTYRWGPLNPGAPDIYGYRQNVAWFSRGWLGVEFFFIISGLVIFMTLERCATPAEFAIRRAARLYPAFIVCMTVTFLVQPFFGISAFNASVTDYIAGLTMASPEFGYNWVDGAYWSLLVEIKFYVWIALFYFGCGKRFIPAWVAFCLFAYIGGHYSSTLSNLCAGEFLPFFTAGMGFYLQFKNGRIGRESGLLLVTAGLMYAVIWRGNDPIVHALTGVMAALFELFVLGRMNWINRTGLAYVGLVSYPFYLIHQNIGVAMIARLEGVWDISWPFVVLAVTVAMIMFATVIHRHVEKPSQKAAREWLHHRAVPVSTR